LVNVQVLGGTGFRLPTEAEWEYACRAGTTSRFSCGDDSGCLYDHAWHEDNAGKTLHSVGTKLPNPWGLYDMHGNVWEWCEDWYADHYPAGPATDPTGPDQPQDERRRRVVRGGAYYIVNVPSDSWHSQCRSAFRHPLTTNPQIKATTYTGYGFRVARNATTD
jgi:formylglycine-generating enzyme required for sulfatase activity